MIQKQWKTLKVTFAIAIPFIIIGTIGIIFNLWFAGLLSIGLLLPPLGFFWAAFQFPEKIVSHCIMCQAGEHKDCLHPRNSVFCCCTTEIDDHKVSTEQSAEKK